MKTDRISAVLWLSLPLTALVSMVSLVGLLYPEIYTKETPGWLIQATTQDAIDLFLIVPFLLVTSLYAYRANLSAFLMWGGILSYLVYTFLIYCFTVHFNILFLPYCLILGLSFYSLLYFLYREIKLPTIRGFINERPVTVARIYFIIISCLFYLLWLLDIIPATLSGTVPKSIDEAGLFTNPVHVIDLSVCLPAIFLTALLLGRKKKAGYQLAPVLLTFFVFMDVTIAVLMAVMATGKIQENLPGILIMSVLSLFSSLLLAWYLRNAREVSY